MKGSKVKMNEAYVVESVTEYFDKQSFHIVKELPFFERHIDIISFDSRKETLIAVEAKVKNWQSAIRQAITCLLFADKVYIAMPKEFIHRVDLSELDRFGIGLMEVSDNGAVKIVSKAQDSKYSSIHHRNLVIERINWFEMVVEGKYVIIE
jgi:hypothetical protein